MSFEEPTVDGRSPMPKGYTFVRKGNVFITRNCRKLCQEAGKPVYVETDKQGMQRGIRVPQHIYHQVRQLNASTQDARAEMVRKKDLALEDKVKAELLRRYPGVPTASVDSILKHTLKKRSGRVGRSKDIPVGQLVDLAVRAHIRHTHTGYDAMLRQGMNRDKARQVINADLSKQVEAWGGKTNDKTAKHPRAMVTTSKGKKKLAKNSKNPSKRSSMATRATNPAATRPRSKSSQLPKSHELEESEGSEWMEQEDSEGSDWMDLD